MSNISYVESLCMGLVSKDHGEESVRIGKEVVLEKTKDNGI